MKALSYKILLFSIFFSYLLYSSLSVTETSSLQTTEDAQDTLDIQQCSICRESFDNNKPISILEYAKNPDNKNRELVRLPCSHEYHGECIGPWILGKAQNSCPLCRAPVFSTMDLFKLGISQSILFITHLSQGTFNSVAITTMLGASYTFVKQVSLSLLAIVIFLISCAISAKHLNNAIQIEKKIIIENNNVSIIDRILSDYITCSFIVLALCFFSIPYSVVESFIYCRESSIISIPKRLQIILMIIGRFAVILSVVYSFLYCWINDRRIGIFAICYITFLVFYYIICYDMLSVASRFWASNLEVLTLPICARAAVFFLDIDHAITDSTDMALFELVLFIAGRFVQSCIYGSSSYCILDSIFNPMASYSE